MFKIKFSETYKCNQFPGIINNEFEVIISQRSQISGWDGRIHFLLFLSQAIKNVGFQR